MGRAKKRTGYYFFKTYGVDQKVACPLVLLIDLSVLILLGEVY